MGETNCERPKKLLNVQFAKILSIEFLLQLGLYILNPNFVNYLVSFGVSIATAGFIAGLNSATSLLLRPVGGFICDLFSKKSLLIVACSGFAIASLGMALSGSPEIVGAFRVMQGLMFLLKSAVVVSLASLVVPANSIGRGVSTMGLGFTVACSLGPALGDLVGNACGYRVSFIVASLSFVAALVLSVSVKPPRSSWGLLASCGGGRKIDLIRDQIKSLRPSELFYLPTLPLAAAVFLSFLAQAFMLSLTLTIANVEGVDHASLYYIVYALFALFSKPLAGRAADKVGLFRVFLPLSFVSCASMVLLAVHFALPTIMAAAVLMAIGQGSVFSCLQSEAVRGIPADKTGRSANMFYIGSDLAQFVAPFLFSAILDHIGASPCFFVAAATTILSPVAYVALCRFFRNGR